MYLTESDLLSVLLLLPYQAAIRIQLQEILNIVFESLLKQGWHLSRCFVTKGRCSLASAGVSYIYILLINQLEFVPAWCSTSFFVLVRSAELQSFRILFYRKQNKHFFLWVLPIKVRCVFLIHFRR